VVARLAVEIRALDDAEEHALVHEESHVHVVVGKDGA
jgi:hypothetical protein